jgi:hypothetical protein
MTEQNPETSRRETAARAAIRAAYGAPAAEHGVTLFVSHHLEEIEPDYWRAQIGSDAPAPEQVLDLLELRGEWSPDSEPGAQILDFTLPDDATDYVISVRFDAAGAIAELSMES